VIFHGDEAVRHDGNRVDATVDQKFSKLRVIAWCLPALLKTDSVASGALPGLPELNIRAKAIEEVVPTYIGRSPPVV
jgi:hypothetical protein